ncbi:LacI family DNA-binding transcriptional regulator [Streptomyces sp. SAS_270]|uniref:LacI family DNA-binding transcriptional regulator n=1 Tax=Streptomyces sp. SAS_270 TaxID=3412748 RepID=UPI00403C6940
MSSRVTLSDVADRAGLSITAVSLILNGKTGTGLSDDARQRVFDAALELDYRPNLMARGLRTEKSATLGFVSDRVASTRYAGPMIRGALRAARERSHTMFVTETEGDPAEQNHAIEALLDRGVDALVLATVTGRIQLPEQRPGVPVVLLNGASPDGSHISVLPDETAGGRQAAEHLIGLGHRRVHLLGVPVHLDDPERVITQVHRRIHSLLNTFRDAGVDVVPVSYEREHWDADAGFDTASRALRDAAPVSAVVALNDAIAAGAYEAFRSAGLRVPEDVSVVSFDDDEIVSFLRPRLSTVALPFEAMGRRSVELALDGAASGEYLEAMHLRVRASTRPGA